jgi:hypothetical protein
MTRIAAQIEEDIAPPTGAERNCSDAGEKEKPRVRRINRP